jgi:hypothetical protein
MKVLSFFKKVDWPNQLFNFLGTLLGVLIAFWLSNYQVNKAKRELLYATQQNLIAEIEKNKEHIIEHIDTVEVAIEAMEALAPLVNDSLDVIATIAQMKEIEEKYNNFYNETSKEAINDSLYNFDGDLNFGFFLLDLSKVAWQNATSTNTSNQFNPDLSYLLFRIYNFQDQADENHKKVIELLKAAITNPEKSRQKELIFNDYLSQLKLSIQFEKALLEYYEVGLKSLKE